MAGGSILYISYDGLCEPLGQSQVYQYLVELSGKYHYQYHLISYEKPIDLVDQRRIDNLRAELFSKNIIWHVLRYHKSPTIVATSYDLICGLILALYLTVFKKVTLLHTRSYVPAVIALIVKKVTRTPFIFDMRGFWADEKVDSGSWAKNSLLYRLAKRFEKRFLLNADKVVSLTNAAVKTLQEFDYMKARPKDIFAVIPTCVNLELFGPPRARKTIQPDEPFILGYVGGVASWYDFDPVLALFKELKIRRPKAKLKIINRGEHDYILKKLHEFGIATSDYEIKTCQHKDVASEILQMNLTAFFIRPTYSKIASAPTKLGEFLACGVPCVTNSKVGDLAEIVDKERVGISIADNNPTTIKRATDQILELLNDPDLPARCRRTAEAHFSLSYATYSYDRIYKQIIN